MGIFLFLGMQRDLLGNYWLYDTGTQMEESEVKGLDNHYALGQVAELSVPLLFVKWV